MKGWGVAVVILASTLLAAPSAGADVRPFKFRVGLTTSLDVTVDTSACATFAADGTGQLLLAGTKVDRGWGWWPGGDPNQPMEASMLDVKSRLAGSGADGLGVAYTLQGSLAYRGAGVPDWWGLGTGTVKVLRADGASISGTAELTPSPWQLAFTGGVRCTVPGG